MRNDQRRAPIWSHGGPHGSYIGRGEHTGTTEQSQSRAPLPDMCWSVPVKWVEKSLIRDLESGAGVGSTVRSVPRSGTEIHRKQWDGSCVDGLANGTRSRSEQN